MDKRAQRIIMAFGVAVLVLIVVELTSPQPVNWMPSYTSTDKIPLGSYVMYNELADIFDNVTVERITKDPFEFLTANDHNDQGVLYIFVNDQINVDPEQFYAISEFVHAGNTALLASNYFGPTVADSLNLTTYVDYTRLNPEVTPQFYSPSLQMDSLTVFNKSIYPASFSSIDTTNTAVLGYFIDDLDQIRHNYVRVAHGKGHFYFLSTPEALTNYYLLKEHQKYTENLLSYFNPTKIYWDEYIKSGRVVITSKMRFVLTQPALKWAYYLTIIGLFMFVIFKGKRQQRIIQVIDPLKNDTKDFTATIGDMHFEYKDYTNITSKRITYFLERIRSELYMQTGTLDDTFIKRLSLKSGNSLDATTQLITLINALRSRPLHSEEDLIKLNKLLEKFTIH